MSCPSGRDPSAPRSSAALGSSSVVDCPRKPSWTMSGTNGLKTGVGDRDLERERTLARCGSHALTLHLSRPSDHCVTTTFRPKWQCTHCPAQTRTDDGGSEGLVEADGLVCDWPRVPRPEPD